ncbi:C40 family peptidase [Candidatus Babeliales bacterium]|nr:C40 family peptidase [Candidatus Babeliales bacterium]MBP9844376.1 C40 family peptidase [Candidatus Babeliales bacterium]
MKNIKLCNWFAVFNLLFFIATTTVEAVYKAVIKESVVDMNSSFPPTPESSPICRGNVSNCHRAHQGLYNEIVDCLEVRGDAVRVVFCNVKYNLSDDPNKNSFWMHKRNLVPLEELDSAFKQFIPDTQYGLKSTLVLTYPWKNFSVGTRFQRRAQDDTESHYGIEFIDFDHNEIMSDVVPVDSALEEIVQNEQATRKLFVGNLSNLIDRVARTEKVIAFVWGGSSFRSGYKNKDFYKENDAWHRSELKNPYTGYDCSELVLRMAQIAGINFPWKTTLAIEQAQRKLTEEDTLENGDLLWFSGFVMIVSDVKNNELIESRGYNSGYGRVQKIKLEQVFEGITTYDDLLRSYRLKQPLRLKNSQGELYLEVNFELLKLM